MATALDDLLSCRDSPDRFDTPAEELLPLQLEAAEERFASCVDRIPLLKNRAESGKVGAIRSTDDLARLAFAHNAYKSYGEAWLAGGQWERMGRWLQTVSTYDGGASHDGVDSLDAWVESLEKAGLYVSCTSGTTGKPAMLGATEMDLDFAARSNVSSFSWATGVEPARDRRFFGLAPVTSVARNEWTHRALVDAFHDPELEPYQLPVPTITAGTIMAMILLRRKISDGSAVASEVAEFERLSAERLTNVNEAFADAVDTLIESREQKLFLSGMWASLHPLAVGVRERGYDATHYRDDNTLLTGGGLKGATLPPDYREFVHATFGVADARDFNLYSMQEINTPFPRCRSARFHVAPWVVALPLDEPGERVLDTTGGPVECRAAFFDLSLEGRWGGVISGDKVTMDFGPCECGGQGPTIGPDIVRYADLAGGDKISCAGTIDAYVQGAA